jgi:hypothetical protein
MGRALVTNVRSRVTGAVLALFAPTATADVWTPPSRKVVADYAARQVVALLLVGTAAAVCWRAGVAGQTLPYVVIGVSRVPDLLVAVLALADPERRSGLRPRRRPGTLGALVSAALAVGALVSAITGSVSVEWIAAFAAAAGLAVAALPTQLVYPASERRSTRGIRAGQTGTSSTAPTA